MFTSHRHDRNHREKQLENERKESKHHSPRTCSQEAPPTPIETNLFFFLLFPFKGVKQFRSILFQHPLTIELLHQNL